jgi:hypothetical protein
MHVLGVVHLLVPDALRALPVERPEDRIKLASFLETVELDIESNRAAVRQRAPTQN